jgi:hypothetical protein
MKAPHHPNKLGVRLILLCGPTGTPSDHRLSRPVCVVHTTLGRMVRSAPSFFILFLLLLIIFIIHEVSGFSLFGRGPANAGKGGVMMGPMSLAGTSSKQWRQGRRHCSFVLDAVPTAVGGRRRVGGQEKKTTTNRRGPYYNNYDWTRKRYRR